MLRALSKFPASTVGIRSSWTCALCKRTALQFQIVTVLEPQLAAPHGWYVRDGLANCGAHDEPETTFAEGAD